MTIMKSKHRESNHSALSGVFRRKLIPCTFALFLFIWSLSVSGQMITTRSLIREMVDLERLASYPDPAYKTVQFSSYDRRSVSPDEPGWFSNSDGFGNEPIPGFIGLIKEKDENGTGEYLMCDVIGPGALVRLWTARIYGDIRFYLDDMSLPFYEGPAQDFFWKTYEALKGEMITDMPDHGFTQNKAGYYPIPFAKRCRIEWIGNIERLHFYHIQFRLYEKDTQVKTFQLKDIETCMDDINRTATILEHPEEGGATSVGSLKTVFETEIMPGETKALLRMKGQAAIKAFTMKVRADDLDDALRKSVLNIIFDGASCSQVQAPVGDFFVTAPGINPYSSLPFTVKEDGWMTCRFIMPFRDSVSIEVQNFGNQAIRIEGDVQSADYVWKDGTSMHFRARWRADHNLVASDETPFDIPYLLANGRGVVVGAATLLMNPTSVPSSHGNWWGEGDEKIFVDNDTFPSFFGTGSEDYYNYAWSSAELFYYGYCGQPRNDGPGNRGHVTNFRWHILDPIPFSERVSFYMELLSHGRVPGFSYARTVYYYGMPAIYDDHIPLTEQDVELPQLPESWSPTGYKFCENALFYEAEELAGSVTQTTLREGRMWTKGKLLLWNPEKNGDELKFRIPVESDGTYVLLFTMCKSPHSGSFQAFIDQQELILGNRSMVDLFEPYGVMSRSISTAPLKLEAGMHPVTFVNKGKEGQSIGIDFIWIIRK